jgi:hypothetical protein
MIKLVSSRALSSAYVLIFPCASIITKSLFLSKLFSKNTSTCDTEKMFLSYYSKASWLKSVVIGNNRSFINCDFPHYWMHLAPHPILRTPEPSCIMNNTSGTYLSLHVSLSNDFWHCIIRGTEKYSDWYWIILYLRLTSEDYSKRLKRNLVEI